MTLDTITRARGRWPEILSTLGVGSFYLKTSMALAQFAAARIDIASMTRTGRAATTAINAVLVAAVSCCFESCGAGTMRPHVAR
jgi:hypothetical protein